ncbi:LPXTG cell wall anchor domain-containing protein, partial [Granulicatella seriolae]
SASDPEDGNYPLDRVELVTDGGFTSEVPGTYAVTFKVTDNDGASNTITVEVIVKRKVNPESKVTPETKIETKVTKNIPQSAVLPKTGSQDWNYLRGLAAIFISSGLLFIGKDFSKKKE